VAGSGDTIDATDDALKISGFLINANVTPITTTFYTVPANKILVILKTTAATIQINSSTIYAGNGNTQSAAGLTSFHNPIFVDEGQSISMFGGGAVLNGYLIDK